MSQSIYYVKRLFPVGLLFVFFCNSTSASDHSSAFTESYFYEDLPVVLSASRLAQAQSNTPTAMTVIDKKMIQASSALNLPDLLRLVPGFTVGFSQAAAAPLPIMVTQMNMPETCRF
jgi:iron complex outermembrane receptor protein